VVHHAFLRIDQTGECRRRDALDPEPGFGGLHTPAGAQAPDGQFLSWQPGKIPIRGNDAHIWTLEPNGDLVFQLHLQPSGKAEMVQPSLGLYFTDTRPILPPFKIGISSFAIDIPAGVRDYRVKESYTLPVDVTLYALLPHAHYLATELRAVATLPDGGQKRLFYIPRWDFNWQGEYNYTRPFSLPKGTTITMDYAFDNSTNNARNPNQPPQRVRYGIQSTDEMAELWLQVRPRNTNDFALLARDYQPRVFNDAIAYNRYLLGLNPQDAKAYAEIGKASLFLGRQVDAASYFKRSIDLAPDFDEPHYFLGLLLRMSGKLPEAARQFETALRLNPQNHKAHGNLGLVHLQQSNLERAEIHLKEALRLNPDDAVARNSLQLIEQARQSKP
jgi:Flp pilus assembly protein TadD